MGHVVSLTDQLMSRPNHFPKLEVLLWLLLHANVDDIDIIHNIENSEENEGGF